MLGVWIPPEDEWTDHVAVMVQGEENAQVQKSCGKRMVVSALKLLHPGRNSTHVSIYYNGYLNVHNAYITKWRIPCRAVFARTTSSKLHVIGKLSCTPRLTTCRIITRIIKSTISRAPYSYILYNATHVRYTQSIQVLSAISI